MTPLLLAAAMVLGTARAEPVDVGGEAATEEAAAFLVEPPLEDPPGAEVAAGRTHRLTKALRCPVCQGLSVADSPSDAARAMGDRIEELVSLGYTEDQITEYFVDRYGPWVELEPPAEGWNRVLFIGPACVVLLGLLLVGMRWRRRQPSAERVMDAYTPDPALAPYRQRILDELGGGQ